MLRKDGAPGVRKMEVLVRAVFWWTQPGAGWDRLRSQFHRQFDALVRYFGRESAVGLLRDLDETLALHGLDGARHILRLSRF